MNSVWISLKFPEEMFLFIFSLLTIVCLNPWGKYFFFTRETDFSSCLVIKTMMDLKSFVFSKNLDIQLYGYNI